MLTVDDNTYLGIQLAELHSHAVDYAKTGAAAEMPRHLHPKRWPHFMDRKSEKYHSTTALGQLYDRVHHSEFHPEYETPFNKDMLRRFPRDYALETRLRKIKKQYDAALRRLMGQRDIKTEFEVFTGFVMSRPRIGSDYKVQDEVGRDSQDLQRRFRNICVALAGGKEFDKLAPVVAAMYRVTEQEVGIALELATSRHLVEETKQVILERNIRDTAMPLTSFPWIFYQVLCQIMVMAGKEKRVEQIHATKDDAASGEDITRSTAKTPTLDGISMTDDGRLMHFGQELDILGPRHDYVDPLDGYGLPVEVEKDKLSRFSKGEPSNRVSVLGSSPNPRGDKSKNDDSCVANRKPSSELWSGADEIDGSVWDATPDSFKSPKRSEPTHTDIQADRRTPGRRSTASGKAIKLRAGKDS